MEGLTYERRDGGGENRAALYDEGHHCSHCDGEVTSHPFKGKREICTHTKTQ